MPEATVGGPVLTNQVVLEGRLAAAPEFRCTPAGRLMARLYVEHLSQETAPDTGGQPQRMELQMPVLALGVLAERCRPLAQGTSLHVEGNLNQKRWIRDGKIRWGQIELQAHQIRVMEQNQLDQRDSGSAASSPAEMTQGNTSPGT
ncbi:MAG: single-stranded DNA-binding protein [Magnetococcales bacterium]|nr:single-stranded DNA-binding protein [Magnetococcales bacterium]